MSSTPYKYKPHSHLFFIFLFLFLIHKSTAISTPHNDHSSDHTSLHSQSIDNQHPHIDTTTNTNTNTSPWFIPDTSSWSYWLLRRLNPFYQPPQLQNRIIRPIKPDGTEASPVEIAINIHDTKIEYDVDEDGSLKYPGLFNMVDVIKARFLKTKKSLDYRHHRFFREAAEERHRENTIKKNTIKKYNPHSLPTQHHHHHAKKNKIDTDKEQQNAFEKQQQTTATPNGWNPYNESDASPVIPQSFAWMIDSQHMHVRANKGLLDIDTARKISELVAASYCNIENLGPWNCTRCDDSFTIKKVVFDPLWDLLAFVGWSDTLDGIVIAFRGTDSHSYYNWAENMRTWRTDLALSYESMPPHALVHGGFFYSYNNSYLAPNLTQAVAEIIEEKQRNAPGMHGGGEGDSWDVDLTTTEGHDSNNTPKSSMPSSSKNDLRNNNIKIKTNDTDDASILLDATPTVFVSGHSLGGALATLCALDLKITLGLPDVRVVTFGSPRVGNYVFAKWFEQEIGPHWRFTHNRDIVPSLPPGYMGFYHVSQEVWVVDLLQGRTLVGVCDGSGEDPLCHNSVCHLGLCSSIADHLLYLSEMYTPHPYGC